MSECKREKSSEEEKETVYKTLAKGQTKDIVKETVH